MEYSKFQVAVVELAHEGTRLTVANVVAHLRVDPEKAEQLLDRMAKDGRLDLEVDEDDGVVVYRVRGLSPKSMTQRLDALRTSIGSEALEQVGTLALGRPEGSGKPLPPSMQRSLLAGGVLGALLPGFGLAYAAPWTVVALAALGVVVGFKVLSFVWLGVPFLMVAAVASGAAGALYTWRYNQTGKRTALGLQRKARALLRG